MRRSGRGGGARRQGTSNASRGFSGRRSSSGSSSSGRGRGRGRGGGSRWRNNSSSNGRGRGRGRGSYKKKLPRKPKGPSMKQLTKRIRTAANAIALGTGDSNALQRTLDEASRWQMTVLDGKTVQQVALEFCRTGLLDQATETVRKIRSGDSLSAAGVAQILSSLPASVEIPPLRGASFVDELLAKTEFADGAVCHEYFRTRARWVVLEYLQESQDARDKMKRIPVDKLVRMGHTVLADTVEKGMKNDELVFRYDSRANRAEDGRRTLQGGDLVQIRFMGNGASSTASESMGSAQSPSPPSLCVEATVELGMPLICKPVLKAHLNKVLQVGSNAPASTRMQWRVDKLANNIQFQRQMRAILTLSTLTTDRAASGTKKTQNKKAGGKNDPRPAREICLAITESCYLSSFNSDGTPHASPTLPNSLSSRWGAPRPGALTSDRVGEVSAASDASATAPSPRGPVLLSGHPIASLCGASCLNQFGQPMPGTRGLDLGASRGLNPSQAAALAAATSRRLTLVQGPPGTGKTQVSVRILQYWVRSGCHASTTGGARGAILACSDSNIAVDNILMGLVKRGVRAVRLGRPENTRPELLQYSVDEMTGAMLDNNSSLGGMTQKQSKQEKHLAKMRVLNRAQVICATCIGAGSQVLDKMRFAAVLIDEAGQATELATVVPLTRGCQQLVLVGDHYQLPPTVTSDDAKAEGLCVSLFERLAQAGVVPALLDTQYRMHPAISCFASDCFYGGRIRDGISARDRPAPRGFHWPRPEFPVAFLDVPAGVEVDDGGSSKANPSEAQLVMRVVSDLVRRGGIRPADVGIVTPYAAQVRALRRLRDREGLRDVECASVDGFQGREKHVIVISTVRANDRGSVGFLKDWCRCNVAITRAQSGLIVVGNERTLRSERRSWAPWLEYVFAHGCAVGYSRTGHYDQSRTRALATGNGRGTSVVPTTAPSAAASSSASQLSLADMQRLRDIAAGGSGRAPRPPAAEIGSRTLAASSVRSLPANSRLRYEAHEVSVPRPTTRASRFGPPVSQDRRSVPVPNVGHILPSQPPLPSTPYAKFATSHAPGSQVAGYASRAVDFAAEAIQNARHARRASQPPSSPRNSRRASSATDLPTEICVGAAATAAQSTTQSPERHSSRSRPRSRSRDRSRRDRSSERRSRSEGHGRSDEKDRARGRAKHSRRSRSRSRERRRHRSRRHRSRSTSISPTAPGPRRPSPGADDASRRSRSPSKNHRDRSRRHTRSKRKHSRRSPTRGRRHGRSESAESHRRSRSPSGSDKPRSKVARVDHSD